VYVDMCVYVHVYIRMCIYMCVYVHTYISVYVRGHDASAHSQKSAVY